MKQLLYITLIIAYALLANWTFNHLDAWMGILIGLIGLLLVMSLIINYIKKKSKQ